MKESEAQRELLSTELNAKAAVYANERAGLLFEHDASLAAANVEVLSFDYQTPLKKVANPDINWVTERITRVYHSEASG